MNIALKNNFWLKTFILFGLFFILAIPSGVKAALNDDLLKGASTRDEYRAIIKNNNGGSQEVTLKGNNLSSSDKNNPPTWTLVTAGGNLEFTPGPYNPGFSGNAMYWVCSDNPNIFVKYQWGGTTNDSIHLVFGTPISNDQLLFSYNYINNDNYTIALDPNDTWDKLNAWKSANWGNDGDGLDGWGFNKSGHIAANLADTIRQNLENLVQVVTKAFTAAVNWLLGMIERILIVDVNQDGVIRGWAIVRNTANIMLILVLLFIALFNVTRFQIDYYNAKILIPRLVLAAIGINFSFVMSKAIVDTANIMTSYFIGQTQATNLLDFNSIIFLSGGGIVIGGILLAVFFLKLFVVIVAGVAVGILLAVLLFRFAVLYVLTIFSPLVFLFGVLPFTRGLTSQWWTYMIKWAFMGTVASLILMAGAAI